MPEPRREPSRAHEPAAAAPERPPAPAKDREHCPQCGRVMQSHRCKLVCECGYFMSCSEF